MRTFSERATSLGIRLTAEQLAHEARIALAVASCSTVLMTLVRARDSALLRAIEAAEASDLAGEWTEIREDSRALKNAFYRSRAWRAARYRALVRHGNRCQCCGIGAASGARIEVDHIQPLSVRPDLALVEDNLQVLCEDCNKGKSNTDQTDWRPAA